MTYCSYEVFEAPTSATEDGKHVFTTPIFEQAIEGIREARKQGKIYGLHGILEDGTKINILLDGKICISTIKTQYSEETYIHAYNNNGMYEENGLAELLQELCFCDDYEIMEQKVVEV